jgi:hypothetical protein
MSKLSQKAAVFNATKSVLADAGHDYEEGMDVSAIMNDQMRKSIIQIVTTAFLKGEVELKDTPSNRAKLASEPEMKKYVNGLVSNWFRKDQDLNGGTKYVIKNPGSRAGSTDPQLKALRQLHTQFKGTEKEAIIKKQIDTRTAQIAQEKASKVVVDISALPADLVESLGLKK